MTYSALGTLRESWSCPEWPLAWRGESDGFPPHPIRKTVATAMNSGLLGMADLLSYLTFLL